MNGEGLAGLNGAVSGECSRRIIIQTQLDDIILARNEAAAIYVTKHFEGAAGTDLAVVV